MTLPKTPLSTITIGSGSQRVVCVHGFSQTKESWLTLVDLLSPGLPDTQFVLVDLPGHGGSAATIADLPHTAELLINVGGKATYIGYSLGARVVLHAALSRPDAVESSVFISGTPGIEDEIERAQRRASDAILADRVEAIGVRAFIDEWLAQPLFASLTPEQARREERCGNTSHGLAASLRSAGTGTQRPLWNQLAECLIPTLLIAGERDEKFRSIATRMNEILPNSELAIIPTAGHSAHLEQPASVAQTVTQFLQRTRAAVPLRIPR
jgi:2-succinyl-6-hydroxy-2,4-cyclohexadiene-1-carboxylate synthase